MSESKVLVVQHMPWGETGRIFDCLEDVGLPRQVVAMRDVSSAILPEFRDMAGFVVVGGFTGEDVMQLPKVKAQLKLIKAVVSVGKPVLAVGLGHQLLALALGAKIVKSPESEQGVVPIKRVDTHEFFAMWNKQMRVLQWHQQAVSAPEGAQVLAKSALVKNEAFRFGSALGLQFHLEVTAPMVDVWLQQELLTGELSPMQAQALREEFAQVNPEMQPLAEQVFSGFAARCASYRRALRYHEALEAVGAGE